MGGLLFKGKITMIITLLFSFFQLPFNKGHELHPFFVSVTEIKQNDKDKIIEVSCKIFTEDLEKTLRQNYNTHVDLLNPDDKKKMNELIFDYIKKHLQIMVNDKPLTLEFVGYEKDEEAIWIYCEVKNIQAIKNIKVTDNLLYDYKKEQINMLHVTVNSIRQSTKLNNPEDKVSFSF